MTAALATLNPAAQVALVSCEQRIERGLKTFIDVGQALAEIRDSRLYKGTHDTFESYLEGRWGMSRAHAYRMISAAEVVSPMGDIENPPTNERQTRALAAVPEPERAEVWREVVERTDGKPTAKVVAEVAKERTTPETPAPAAATTAPVAGAGSTSPEPEQRHLRMVREPEPAVSPERAEAERVQEQDRQIVARGVKTAPRIVTEVRVMVSEIVGAVDLGAAGLITQQMITDLRVAVALLESRLEASR